MCQLTEEQWRELDDRLVALQSLLPSQPSHDVLVCELRSIIGTVIYDNFLEKGLLPSHWEQLHGLGRSAVFPQRFGGSLQELPRTMGHLFNCIVKLVKAPPLQSERTRLASDLRDWLAGYLKLRGQTDAQESAISSRATCRPCPIRIEKRTGKAFAVTREGRVPLTGSEATVLQALIDAYPAALVGDEFRREATPVGAPDRHVRILKKHAALCPYLKTPDGTKGGGYGIGWPEDPPA